MEAGGLKGRREMLRRKVKAELADVHAHILPGVDDGAESLEEARQMLQMAYDQGIRRIIATPHYRRGQDAVRLRELAQELQKEAEKIDSNFRIYLGQELMDSEELLEDLKEGRAFTMAGSRYILIEFQPVVSFSHMCQRLRQLQMAGYLPVIAHMERYECLKRGERVRDLIQAGNFTQMNFSSLQGNPLHKNTRWCRRQVLDGNVHLLGTDMHHINQRTPDIKKAVSWLSRNCTRSRLYWMVWKNPAYIIKKKEGMGR